MAPEKIKVLESAEDEIIRHIYDQFKSGNWRWIRGQENDGENGYCLLGALKQSADDLKLRGRYDYAYWKVAEELPSRDIIHFNDGLGVVWRTRIGPFFPVEDKTGKVHPDILRVLEKALCQEP